MEAKQAAEVRVQREKKELEETEERERSEREKDGRREQKLKEREQLQQRERDAGKSEEDKLWELPYDAKEAIFTAEMAEFEAITSSARNNEAKMKAIKAQLEKSKLLSVIMTRTHRATPSTTPAWFNTVTALQATMLTAKYCEAADADGKDISHDNTSKLMVAAIGIFGSTVYAESRWKALNAMAKENDGLRLTFPAHLQSTMDKDEPMWGEITIYLRATLFIRSAEAMAFVRGVDTLTKAEATDTLMTVRAHQGIG